MWNASTLSVAAVEKGGAFALRGFVWGVELRNLKVFWGYGFKMPAYCCKTAAPLPLTGNKRPAPQIHGLRIRIYGFNDTDFGRCHGHGYSTRELLIGKLWSKAPRWADRDDLNAWKEPVTDTLFGLNGTKRTNEKQLLSGKHRGCILPFLDVVTTLRDNNRRCKRRTSLHRTLSRISAIRFLIRSGNLTENAHNQYYLTNRYFFCLNTWGLPRRLPRVLAILVPRAFWSRPPKGPGNEGAFSGAKTGFL